MNIIALTQSEVNKLGYHFECTLILGCLLGKSSFLFQNLGPGYSRDKPDVEQSSGDQKQWQLGGQIRLEFVLNQLFIIAGHKKSKPEKLKLGSAQAENQSFNSTHPNKTEQEIKTAIQVYYQVHLSYFFVFFVELTHDLDSFDQNWQLTNLFLTRNTKWVWGRLAGASRWAADDTTTDICAATWKYIPARPEFQPKNFHFCITFACSLLQHLTFIYIFWPQGEVRCSEF